MPRRRGEQGRVRVVGRHDLRIARRDPDARVGAADSRVSPYGVAKKAVGDYLHYYRQEHGLESTALALANVYGPRQDPHGEAGVVAIFAGKLLSGETPVIFGDGSQTRDFVFVDDVVDAFVRASDRGGGLLLNVGTGTETSVVELYEAMARLVKHKGKPRHAPARVGELARSALDPARRDAPRLEAVDLARRGPLPHPRPLPRSLGERLGT